MDSKYLSNLSTQIGSEWQLFGVHLGFSLSQMEQLRYAYPNSIQQCVSAILNHWCAIIEENGIQAAPLLEEALRESDRTDLADDLNVKFQRLSTDISSKSELVNQPSLDIDELDGPIGVHSRRNSNRREDKRTDLKVALKKVRFENISSDPLYRYIEQSKAYMEQKLKNKRQFVITRAFHKAMDCLEKNGILTVIGNAGDGKSTLAIQILHRLQKQGYLIIVLSDPGILEQTIDPDRKIVYFVDDAFGTPTLNKGLLQIWVRLYDKIDSLVETGKMSLVLTSRKLVFLKGKNVICRHRRFEQALVDVTDSNLCLNEVEKRMMIANHSQGHIRFPKDVMRNLQGYTPGFPLMCKLYSSNKRLWKIDVFEKPIVILEKDISNLLEHDIHAFCVMVLIVLCDGKLPVEYLDVFGEESIADMTLDTVVRSYSLDKITALSKMESSISSIIGVYVEQVSDSYVFLHDSVFDAVCLIFGRKHPREILRIASSSFIEQRVRTPGSICKTESENTDVIVLKSYHFKTLSNRWIRDIINGHIRNVINNPSIQDRNMLACFIDAIKLLPPVEFIDLIGCSECEKCLLEYVFQEGITLLASELLQRIRSTEELSNLEIPQKCLLVSIERKDVALVKLLLDFGISTTVCTRPHKTTSVHMAAHIGDAEILRLILEKNKCKSISKNDYFGMKPIHYASQNSNFSCVELLIKNGSDIDCEDSDGKRPIHYACFNGDEEFVKCLHNAGANFCRKDLMGRTPLHFSAMNSNVEVVNYLLKLGCDANEIDSEHRTPLFYACKNGQWKNIKALMDRGADSSIRDINMKLPIHAAVEGCHRNNADASSCLRILLGVHTNINAVDDQGKTALHYACAWSFDNRFDSVQVLVELEADVNVVDNFKMQPLMYACNSGSFNSAALLLLHGADPNNEGPRKNKPIHLASADGNINIVKLLMDKSVDIKAKNEDGRQPIHFSSQYGNDEVIAFLVWNGADVNAQDDTGKRPLHYACKWGRTATVKHLLKLGADPLVKDNDNFLPKDFIPAWASNSETIRRYLSCSSSL